MSRIKIDLPDKFSFTTTIPVRITDINYGGHVGNDTILSLIHEARMQFLSNAGLSEIEFGEAALIMAHAGIDFKKELFYGEKVIVSVKADSFSRVSFDIYYKLEKETTGEREMVAAAQTTMVCYNYKTQKVVSVPVMAKEKLAPA